MTKFSRRDGFAARERAYFDDLVKRTGDTWWGNHSPAGSWRLDRRAQIMVRAIPAGANVLELGCGAGAITHRLLSLAPTIRLLATDISSVGLAAAQRSCAGFANCELLEADIMELPAIGRFGAIVGNGILHHLPVKAAVDVLTGLLETDARILFFEPNLLNPHVAIEKTIRPVGRLLGNTEDETAFSRFQIAALLRAAGFTSVRVTPIDFIHPKTPEAILPLVAKAGDWLERMPLSRELAGTLCIQARWRGRSASA